MLAVLRQPRTIRAKLRRLVIVSIGIALLVNSVLGLGHEARRYLDLKREGLLATAQAFSAASAPAVASGDQQAVFRAIRAIARVPGLVYAEVQDESGAIIYQLGGAVRLSGDLDLTEQEGGSILHLLSSRTVQVSVPTVDQGRTVGRLILVSDIEGLSERFGNMLLLAALGSSLAVAIGLAISLRLQRSITEPLTELGQAMARIERTHDYSGNVAHDRDDELGVLASSFNSMMSEIRRATGEIVSRENEIIVRLSRATERRDGETGEHITRMAALCRMTAESLGLDGRRVQAIQQAAPLHDIGKLGVPDAIMFKAGRYDAEERRAMERHAEYGYEVLRDSESELIRLAAEMALCHHERWDGSGYPRGLRGDAIPLSGRIAAVSDVADALASRRVYKPGWSLDEVRDHLVQNSGTAFDPDCVAALIRRWPAVEAMYAGSNAAPGQQPIAA